MVATHNNLPIYEALVDGDGAGMYCVSLVDDPAIESNFLAFDKQKPLKFSVEDEEQRMVLGAVMVPDMLIYRRDEEGFEYYIKYSKETIAKMNEKYFASLACNNVDTDHSFELVDGVTLVQSFIKDTEKGINPVGFEDLPDGTLFYQYHITSDEIWEGIKDGTWKGFSLAGYFNVKEVELHKTNILDDIEDLLKKIENKLNKK